MLLGGGFAGVFPRGGADELAQAVGGVVVGLGQEAEENAGHFITKSLLVIFRVPELAAPEALESFFCPPGTKFLKQGAGADGFEGSPEAVGDGGFAACHLVLKAHGQRFIQPPWQGEFAKGMVGEFVGQGAEKRGIAEVLRRWGQRGDMGIASACDHDARTEAHVVAREIVGDVKMIEIRLQDEDHGLFPDTFPRERTQLVGHGAPGGFQGFEHPFPAGGRKRRQQDKVRRFRQHQPGVTSHRSEPGEPEPHHLIQRRGVVRLRHHGIDPFENREPFRVGQALVIREPGRIHGEFRQRPSRLAAPWGSGETIGAGIP